MTNQMQYAADAAEQVLKDIETNMLHLRWWGEPEKYIAVSGNEYIGTFEWSNPEDCGEINGNPIPQKTGNITAKIMNKTIKGSITSGGCVFFHNQKPEAL